MNKLPIAPLSPEEQQCALSQLYVLMGKQAQSYHKHRHMGNHSSISLELAQEIMESIVYTLAPVGGAYSGQNLEEALCRGQKILADKLNQAKAMLELVAATAPRWQTECRWDALRYLELYLANYDHLHLAHQGPDGLFYPILIAPPEGIRGIDSCCFYLNILWIENQIMAGVPEDALQGFWRHLPVATLNQCEQLLINGMGKALLNAGIDPLVFTPEDHLRIAAIMPNATDETLKAAAKVLFDWLDLKNDAAKRYAEAILPQLSLWIGGRIPSRDPENLFIS